MVGIAISLIVVLSMSITPAQADLRSNQMVTAEKDEDLAPRVDYHNETGMLAFIGADPQKPIQIAGAMRPGLLPADKAMAALNEFGPAFGINNPSSELTLMKQNMSDGGLSSTRYQQVYNGVPIVAGELIVNMDSRGGLLSIGGEVSPQLDLSVTPEISAEDAKARAITAVAKVYGLAAEEFASSEPELWIYDARLLIRSTRPAVLVWRMEVDGIERFEINELVLVDAISGSIPLRFNQVDTARNRLTYDAGNLTVLPGTLRCNEADPTCSVGDAHEAAAHIYAGDTYDFYSTFHGRDSINDGGMTIVSTVHYGSSYANAFWSGTYQQMVYGDAYGFPLADDVVAHELTHGVTDYTSNLFYYYESGAINESLSDIWGEFVDQWNGSGTDTPGVKWLLGEDISGMGAIRSMSNPPAYGDPDAMTHANYFETSGDVGDFGFDNGGVHYNSGVNNKAAYLLTDGGSHNGETVTMLGMSKVADIYYAVQTSYLTTGSGYSDLYNYLYQACLGLIGGASGITSSDCGEVRDATDAVRMDQEPSTGYSPDPDLCPSDQFPGYLFFDDIESGSSNWSFGAEGGGTTRWSWDTGYSSSGTRMLWGADDIFMNDTYSAMSLDVTLPTNSQPYLYFDHAFGFEDGRWDGGQLDYSTNSGSSWVDASSLFDAGLDYNGTIRAGTGNPHGDESGFVNDSHGYVSSRYDLSTLVGQDVRFRWRVTTDVSANDIGWFVDDVRIYFCGEPIFIPLASK